MLLKSIRTIKNIQNNLNVSVNISKGIASRETRNINAEDVNSFEFSGFSQNGEDGIIEYLVNRIKKPNWYFVEIGASNGIENNTSWLAIVKKWTGLMIEGSKEQSLNTKRMMSRFNLGVEVIQQFISLENSDVLLKLSRFFDPDFFSIDIDGNDYHILNGLLKNGFRPKVISVEYNSVFGPHQSLTIPYEHDFNYMNASETGLYYGVSIEAFRRLLVRDFGYRFICVDRNGVNAFFINQNEVEIPINIHGFEFKENFFQIQKYKKNWDELFLLLKNKKFLEIS